MAEADETSAGQLELAPERVKELLDAGEATLVDVREDTEWEAGRVPGAVHLELNELTSRAEEVPKERVVVFYCRTGNRSGMAAEAFAPADGKVLDRRGRPPG